MKFKVRGIRLDTGSPASGTVEATDEEEARRKAGRRLQIMSIVMIDEDGIPIATMVSPGPVALQVPAHTEPALSGSAYASVAHSSASTYGTAALTGSRYGHADPEAENAYAPPAESYHNGHASAEDEEPAAAEADVIPGFAAPSDDAPSEEAAPYASGETAEPTSIDSHPVGVSAGYNEQVPHYVAPDDAPEEAAHEEESEAAYAAAYAAAAEPVIAAPQPVATPARSTAAGSRAIARPAPAIGAAPIAYANAQTATPDYKDILVGNKWLKLYATIVSILGWICIAVGGLVLVFGVITGLSASGGIATMLGAALPGFAIVMYGVLMFVAAGAIRLLCGIGMAVRDMARHTLSR